MMRGNVMSSLRRMMALAGCALLVACSTPAPPYQPTVDNARALGSMPNTKLALGSFTTSDPSMNTLGIRASSFYSPVGSSFADYLKDALQSELVSAGKFNTGSNIVVGGEMTENKLDAAIGTGTAHIGVRFNVMRDGKKVFDKVVTADREWDSSFIGAVAIPAARTGYIATIKDEIAHLLADQDFQNALR
ncbi:MAG TPA: hypothetical protein VF472_12040 [Burkholderiaceae bacterium]